MSSTERRGAVPIGTGFWNCTGAAQYSKGTQELLKVMMQESRLTNFQQRQIGERLKKGDSLPLQCNPTSSHVTQAPPPPAKPSHVVTVSSKPQLRPAEHCRAGDAYSREKFKPKPTRDLEKEKQRLQRILATGKDGPEPKPEQRTIQKEKEEVMEIDRFEELINEIKERHDFLTEMESLGQGKKYRGIIYTEISQKVREMEEIDKKRTAEVKHMLESYNQQKEGNNSS